MTESAQERANRIWNVTDADNEDYPSNVTAHIIYESSNTNVNSNYREVAATIENGGDGGMDENKYVDQRDLEHLKNYLEQKIDFNQSLVLEKVDASKNETNLKLDSMSKEINLKFDNQLHQFKGLLNEKFEEQKEKQRNNTKWIIGTIIGVAGLAHTIATFFM